MSYNCIKYILYSIYDIKEGLVMITERLSALANLQPSPCKSQSMWTKKVAVYSFLCIAINVSTSPHLSEKAKRQTAAFTHWAKEMDQLCECPFLLRKCMPSNLLNKSSSHSCHDKPQVSSEINRAIAGSEWFSSPSSYSHFDRFYPGVYSYQFNEFAPHFHSCNRVPHLAFGVMCQKITKIT